MTYDHIPGKPIVDPSPAFERSFSATLTAEQKALISRLADLREYQAKLFDACADNDAAARKRGEKTFGDGKYTVGLRNEARGLREEAYHLREMVNPGNEKVYSLDGEWRYEDQKW